MKTLLAILSLSVPNFYQSPVISPGLTAVYEDRQQIVKLKWNHNDKRVNRYVLERSSDNNRWLTIYSTSLENPQHYKFISFYDSQVQAGRNYYRLKAVMATGVEYTAPIMVIIGKPGNGWLIYPVPVRDVLNLQYNGNALITGVISVVIQRMNGQVYHQVRFASSTRLISIPVGNLGSGTYDVRILINNKTVWNQRFIK